MKVAKASEAISNVDISTYLKKSLNCSEKSMILANGSCRIHSLSIIPQRKAIFGDSYLENGRKQKRSNHKRPKTGDFRAIVKFVAQEICAREGPAHAQCVPEPEQLQDCSS